MTIPSMPSRQRSWLDHWRQRAQDWRIRAAFILALLAPAGACAALAPSRSTVPAADSALILVAVVVLVSTLGHRVSGIVAAISAGVWFDLLLTAPYGRLAIDSGADVGTVLLLLAVGVVTTELSIWGRRRSATADQQASYLEGLLDASAVLASGGSPTGLAERIEKLLVDVLGLSRCHFRFDTDPNAPTLHRDGSLTWGDALWDADENGLPLTVQTQIPVVSHGIVRGRFLMTPNAGARPGLERRLIAASFAAQVGAAFHDFHETTS